jgi:hypothetical protein
MIKKKHTPQRVETENAKFDEWRRRNPSKPFKDFFAETVKAKLDKGKPHATLGGKLLFDEYTVSGQGFFKRLLDCGLKPDGVCVDYGCGTLRIGLHVINFLGPRAYWGLDIAEFLLAEGRKLIGDELWAEKQPQLRVISPQSVAEAAAAKPAMLFSSAVMLHVHPQELPEYVQNIMTIIGTKGQAVIDVHLHDGETIQYSGRSWAHAAALFEQLIADAGGKSIILGEGSIELEEFGKTARRCILRIVHENHAAG